jgi:hypothetical protein
VSVGTSAGSTSAGVGRDGGSASSTTQAAISGIAGNQAARTGDAEAAITPIFDKEAVSKEVNAQAQITAEFGRNASRAVGDYATDKLKEAEARRRQADTEQDPDKKAQLVREAEALEAAWGEGRPARVALHAAVGALTGGIDGAIGAVASQTAVPVIGEQIAQLDAPEDVKKALVQIAGTVIGAATGGAAGAMTATNATANNYLLHTELSQKAAQLAACKTDACRKDVEAHWSRISQQRNQDMQASCLDGSSQQCRANVTQMTQDLAELTAASDPQRNGVSGFTPEERNNIKQVMAQTRTNLEELALRGNERLGTTYSSPDDLVRAGLLTPQEGQLLEAARLGNMTDFLGSVALPSGARSNANRPVQGAQGSQSAETPPKRPTQDADNRVVGDGDLPNVYANQRQSQQTPEEVHGQLLNRVDQTRRELDGVLPPKAGPGNVGVAEIQIDGQPATVSRAHSQVGNDAASQREGFVSLPPEGQRILQPLQNPLDPVPREVDTEYKILENFAQQNRGNTNVSGRIDLFTERPPCTSCTNVIDKQFADLFPNMEVRVFHNNGQITTYRNGQATTVTLPGNNPRGWPTMPNTDKPPKK